MRGEPPREAALPAEPLPVAEAQGEQQEAAERGRPWAMEEVGSDGAWRLAGESQSDGESRSAAVSRLEVVSRSVAVSQSVWLSASERQQKCQYAQR